jgi:hypothetical protein
MRRFLFILLMIFLSACGDERVTCRVDCLEGCTEEEEKQFCEELKDQ